MTIARGRSVILSNSVILDNALSVTFDNTCVIQDNTFIRDLDEFEGLQFVADTFGKLSADMPSFSERCVVLWALIFGTGQEVDVGFFGGVDGVGAPCGAAEELEDVIRLCHNKVVPSRHGDVDE